MVTLTIWRFDSVDGAHRAAETVGEMAKSQVVPVHDAAVVWWEEGQRRAKLRQLDNIAGRDALNSAFWGVLFGLIFLLPLRGAAGGALSDVGIDDDLIRRVRAQLTPGTSALFLLTSSAVLEKVREAFAGADQPELIFTNLSDEQESALREAFSDDPTSAPR